MRAWHTERWPKPEASHHSLNPHLAPQPLDPLSVRFDPVVALQDRHQAATPNAGIRHVDFVHNPHQPVVFLAFLHWPVVQRGT